MTKYMPAITAVLWAAAGAVPASAAPAQTSSDLYQVVSDRLTQMPEAQASAKGQAMASFAPTTPEFSLKRDNAPADIQGRLQQTPDAQEKLQIPQDAKQFLPDEESHPVPGSLWDKDSATTHEAAQRLEDYFKKFYPDVTYQIDWDNDTANAYAWKNGDQRFVMILGGLIRHKAIQMEGISLVLAHELGHHYGGEPTYPGSGLSCEGQADYWGAKTGMRTVWREQYRAQMMPAIQQVYAFLSRGVRKDIAAASGWPWSKKPKGCDHPPADCRLQTYQAAMDDKPKPECAGVRKDLLELSWASPAQDSQN